MATSQYQRGDTAPVLAPVATALAVSKGDIVGLTSDTLALASATAWDTNIATTQTAFATTFLGVAAQRKVADVARVDANSEDNVIRVDTEGVYEFDCDSATFNVGDFVGPAKQTGNALEDQKVVEVSGIALAIGRVAEKVTGTRVKVKLLSTMLPAAR